MVRSLSRQPVARPKSRVGRADLVYLLRAGEACLEALAEDLGFQRDERDRPAAPAPAPSPRGHRPSRDVVAKPTSTAATRPRYHYVASRQLKPAGDVNWDEPQWFVKAQSLEPGDTLLESALRPPAMIPLTPRERLLPFFLRVLTRLRPGRRLHQRRLVDRVGRGQPITHLPLRWRRRWSPAARVILDMDPRLAPLRPDMNLLAATLLRFRGGEGLDLRTLDAGPEGPCRLWRQPGGSHRTDLPPAGCPVLVVSDLGCLDPGSGRRQAWRRFGRRLVNAGLQPIALVPFSPRYWDSELSPYWRPVFWDRGSRLRPMRPPRPVTDDADTDVAMSRVNAVVADLLALLSPAVRVEPPLLRAVRLALPRREAEVAAEVLLWSHAHVFAEVHAMALLPEFVQAHRDNFEKYPGTGLKNHVLDQIRAHHLGLPFVIRDEERRTEMAMRGQAPAQPTPADLMARVARTFADGKDSPRLQAWMKRVSGRQHAAMWADEALAAAFIFAERPGEAGGWHALPRGFPIDRMAWAMKRDEGPRSWVLWDDGSERHWREVGASGEAGDLQTGSPLVLLRSHTGLIRILPDGQDPLDLELADGLPLPESGAWGQGLRLETDAAVLMLKTMTRPEWAKSIGRNERGLYVTFRQGKREQRAYWLNPCLLGFEGGRLRAFAEGEAASLGEVAAGDGSLLAEGCWVDADLFSALTGSGLARPSWVRQWGRDRHGLWADAELAGIRQRFRLIPPGRFDMGSPEDEPGRWSSERQHRVHLTRGFWLADTACPQALWQAVMGENPSGFKGEDLPVEAVSWDEVQAFIRKLNGARAELTLRLPSEAEWEYACRAGTTTPFSSGSDLTTDQANYDGNYPYAGGEKGIYRGKTMGVTDLASNPWGLFQMHANVREWCADWFQENYPEGAVVNPVGPEAGRLRVLRGGGWLDLARGCRSASRDWFSPDDRLQDLGFRVAGVL